ncbi:hypothetical protein QCA50_017546 [Cerrena zonata]|uniref:Uncharacterized protein n=1 Tax=Cerrena zonata TaxID=2478898 RepID=A0AAW0FGX8_9APHY
MPLQVRASLQSTGNGPEVIVSAAHELNFTKSKVEKSWLNCGSLNAREMLGIVLGPQKRFPIAIPTFARARDVREDAVEAKTSFGQPSINKALLNLGKLHPTVNTVFGARPACFSHYMKEGKWAESKHS